MAENPTEKQVIKKKAAPGWYPDPKKPGELRKWDGQKWLDEWKRDNEAAKEPSSWMIMGLGILVLTGALGAVFLGVEDGLAFSIPVWAFGGFVGGTLFQIGVIAKAVQVGNRSSR